MLYDAADKWLRTRLLMPTHLKSKGLAQIAPAIRASSFFSAQVAKGHVLDTLRKVSDRFTKGEMDLATARLELKRMLGTQYEPGSADDRKLSNLASTARLDLILRQNARMAMAVGEYQQGMDETARKMFPYWRYVKSTSASPRESHAIYNGKVFRKDDPIWHRIFPPSEFNCKCSVEEVAADEVGEKDVQKPTDREKLPPLPESGFSFDPADALGVIDPSCINDEALRENTIGKLKEMGCVVHGDGMLEISQDYLEYKEFMANLPDYPVPPEIKEEEYDDEYNAKLSEYARNIAYLDEHRLGGSFQNIRETQEGCNFIERWIDEWKVMRNVRHIAAKDELGPEFRIEAFSPAMEKQARKACDYLRRIITGDVLDASSVIKFVKMTEEDKNREGYSVQQDAIHASEHSKISVLLHEIGHHIEKHNAFIGKVCQNFLKERCTGCPIVKLSKLTGDDYDDEEEAYDDHFVGNDVYAGKVYIDERNNIYGTEILSHGIECLVTDPAGFKKRDSVYYNLVCKLLKNARW